MPFYQPHCPKACGDRGFDVKNERVRKPQKACNQGLPGILPRNGRSGNDQSLIEEIGDAIINLREERQSILTEVALKHDLQERMEDLIAFLNEQAEA